jgi:hypothetical protein
MLGILDQLSPEQQEQLIDWIESFTAKEVLEKVAAPEPEGFGIKTHATSLRRFYDKWHASQKTEDLQSAFHQLEGTDDPMLSKGISSALTRQAFRTVTGPKRAQMTLDQATKWIITMEKQQLREKELELAKRRLDLEEKKAAWTAMIQSANCEFMCNEVEDTRISIFHPEPDPEPTPDPVAHASNPVWEHLAGVGSVPLPHEHFASPRTSRDDETPIQNVDASDSLSLGEGPLSAKRTNHDGDLACGGVGNSLDKGEGSSASSAQKTQPQNTPQTPVVIDENTPTHINLNPSLMGSSQCEEAHLKDACPVGKIQNLDSKINEPSLPGIKPTEIASPNGTVDLEPSCNDSLSIRNGEDKGEGSSASRGLKTQTQNTAKVPVSI